MGESNYFLEKCSCDKNFSSGMMWKKFYCVLYRTKILLNERNSVRTLTLSAAHCRTVFSVLDKKSVHLMGQHRPILLFKVFRLVYSALVLVCDLFL
jgi:hypothetical protein